MFDRVHYPPIILRFTARCSRTDDIARRVGPSHAGDLGISAYVLLHGGVRPHRGCTVDTPLYEIVNVPAWVLRAVVSNELLPPEGVGHPSETGRRLMAFRARTFSAPAFLAFGAFFYACLGAGLAVTQKHVRRLGSS